MVVRFDNHRYIMRAGVLAQFLQAGCHSGFGLVAGCGEETDGEYARMRHRLLEQIVISVSQLFKAVFEGELKTY